MMTDIDVTYASVAACMDRLRRPPLVINGEEYPLWVADAFCELVSMHGDDPAAALRSLEGGKTAILLSGKMITRYKDSLHFVKRDAYSYRQCILGVKGLLNG